MSQDWNFVQCLYHAVIGPSIHSKQLTLMSMMELYSGESKWGEGAVLGKKFLMNDLLVETSQIARWGFVDMFNTRKKHTKSVSYKI